AHFPLIGGPLVVSRPENCRIYGARQGFSTEAPGLNDALPGKADSMDLTIFDCDGGLVDSEISSSETQREALPRPGAASSARELPGRCAARTTAAMCATIARETANRLPPGSAHRTKAHCPAAFDAGLRLVAGIAELRAGLTGPRGVASSSVPPRIRHCLALA